MSFSAYTQKPLWIKILLGSVLLLLILFLSASLILWTKPKFLSRWVEQSIQNKLQEASKGVYHFEYSSLQIDLASQSIRMTDLTIYTDSIQSQRQLKSNTQLPVLINFKAKEVVATHFSTLSLLVGNRLKLNTVLIKHSTTHVNLLKKEDNQQIEESIPKQPKRKTIGRVSIDNIEVEDASVMIVNQQVDNELKAGIYNMTLQLKNFDVTPHDFFNKQKILGSENIALKADKIEFPSEDNLYTCILDSIQLASQDSSFTVGHLSYLPVDSKYEFHAKLKVAKPRMHFDLSTIEGRGLDIRKLINDREIDLRHLLLSEGNLDFFKDKHYPKPTKNYIGHYPHQLLLKAPIPTKLDSLLVKAININYCELGSTTNKEGCISFMNTTGVIKNITNKEAFIASNSLCHADLITQFMGQFPLNAYFTFHLDQKNGQFSCKGELGHFPITQVNGFVGSLAQASIQSGIVNNLDFTIDANDYQSNIVMDMQYHDLKVNLFKQPQDGSARKKRKFLMKIVNNILIEQNNPTIGDAPRIGKTTFKRETNQPFFTVIWNTIQSALLQIVIGKESTTTKK